MEDQNQNMIPDKLDRVILRIGAALAACLSTYASILAKTGQPVPMWLAIAAPVLPTALVFFSFKDAKADQPADEKKDAADAGKD